MQPGIDPAGQESHDRRMPAVTTTYLEMRSIAELRPKPCADPKFWVGETVVPQWQFNRFFYYTVGEAWAWRDKRVWTEEQWRAYAETSGMRTWVGYWEGSPVGYCELQPEADGGIEITNFGLLPAFLGRGLGGALLTRGIEEAFRLNPSRLWLHTCSNDHPAALANYVARGMRIYKTETA